MQFLSCMDPSFARTGINHRPSVAVMKNNIFFSKIIELLFQGQDRIADALTEGQLLGLWMWFHLVILFAPQTDDFISPQRGAKCVC